MSKRKSVGRFDVTLDESTYSSSMSCVEGNNYDVDDHGNLHISGGDEAAVFAAGQWAYAKYQPPGDEPDEVSITLPEGVTPDEALRVLQRLTTVHKEN